MADHPGAVSEREEVVVVPGQATAARDLRIYGRDWAEQMQRLIDQVAAEVQQQAAAVRGRVALAPCVRTGLRAPALESRLVAQHVAQGAVSDQLDERQLVRVPAAVLERGQQHAAPLGVCDQLIGLRGVERQRLVDDHRQAVVDRLRGERRMRVIGGRDHDSVQVLSLSPELLGRIDELRLGVVAAGLLATLSVGGDDRGDPEAWGRCDQRRVEDAPRQAVADDRNTFV